MIDKKAICGKVLIAILFIAISCQQPSKDSETGSTEATTVKNDAKPSNKEEIISSEPKGPILGLDVSHFQGNVNWQQIKKDSLKWGYAKVSQGDSFKDPYFVKNRDGANSAKLPLGGYHFYVSSDKPVQQANNFLSSIKPLQDGDLPPVLDLEQGGAQGKPDKVLFQKEILIWLITVEKELGVKPIIYTNNPFANEYLNDPKFLEYPLWIAEYTKAAQPKVPEVWKEVGWLMWQRSQRGAYKGVPGQSVDHDIFKGNYEKLLNLTAR